MIVMNLLVTMAVKERPRSALQVSELHRGADSCHSRFTSDEILLIPNSGLSDVINQFYFCISVASNNYDLTH